MQDVVALQCVTELHGKTTDALHMFGEVPPPCISSGDRGVQFEFLQLEVASVP